MPSKQTQTQINIDLDEPKYRGEKRKRYQQLVELKDFLIDQVSQISGASLSHQHSPGEDMADVGSDNFIREIGLTVATEEGKRILLIQDALRALADGRYGKCIDCSVEIESGRLDAIPYAKLCVKCKSIREEEETDIVSERIDFDEEITE